VGRPVDPQMAVVRGNGDHEILGHRQLLEALNRCRAPLVEEIDLLLRRDLCQHRAKADHRLHQRPELVPDRAFHNLVADPGSLRPFLRRKEQAGDLFQHLPDLVNIDQFGRELSRPDRAFNPDLNVAEGIHPA